jgi:hypothetical protein
MSCNICCEKYKKSPIVCGFCEFAACNDCCETYLLSESKPKCMNASCGKDWDRKFIKNNFKPSFITKNFKKHMENILYEKEKALMPATQPLVENKIRRDKLREEEIEINNKIKELCEQVRILRERKVMINNEKYRLDNRENTTEKYNHRHYVRACPADGCRGFLDEKFNCGLCNTNVCRKCNEIIVNSNSEHKCSEENIATVKCLEKETRPCPKCSVKIFKIDGCDQMWCVQCHTAFSWKTGNIETKIHNPHYYEWKRKNGGLEPEQHIGGGAAAADCNNDLITEYTMNRLTNAILKKNHNNLFQKSSYGQNNIYNSNVENMIEIIKNTIHNHTVEMPVFRTDIIKNNENLRIQFMNNEISEEKFKTMIQRNDKKNVKQAEFYDILQFAETTIADIINRMVDDLTNSLQNKHNFHKIYLEINGLREYCNNAFNDISKTYDCVLYNFDNNFHFANIVQTDKQKMDHVEDLERTARIWLKDMLWIVDRMWQRDNTIVPEFSIDNPTACRKAAIAYYKKKIQEKVRIDTPNWIKIVYDCETNTEVVTCDMTV